MGAGKEGAGDGAGKEQAVEEPPQPVVLRMVLHCEGCAKKVRKSIHHMPGVVSVVANTAANTVIVEGTADAAALKARIESKTKKPVEILSAGGGSGAAQNKPPPAEPKKNNSDTEKHNPDKGGEDHKINSDKGDKGGASQPPPQPKEEKKQPPEKKPVQETITPTTAVLRIRLHCDSCADRIRRRIFKIKGVKDVILEANAKDEVTVVGTMDVPAMVVYLNGKLNRTVELATSPASKDDGHIKDKSGGDGHVKDKAAPAADAHKGDKGKGIEVAGPSMASAAAYMAPATAMANTHHVSPYGYGNVAYPPPPQGPPPGYYNSSYYGGGNADGAGYATPYYPQPRADAGSYYQQPRGDSGRYYQDQPRGDAGSYYQQQPSADAGSYYQQQPRADANGGSYYSGGYDQPPNPPPYQAYPFDTAPPPQMFSDENPNSCSVM